MLDGGRLRNCMSKTSLIITIQLCLVDSDCLMFCERIMLSLCILNWLDFIVTDDTDSSSIIGFVFFFVFFF